MRRAADAARLVRGQRMITRYMCRGGIGWTDSHSENEYSFDLTRLYQKCYEQPLDCGLWLESKNIHDSIWRIRPQSTVGGAIESGILIEFYWPYRMQSPQQIEER